MRVLGAVVALALALLTGVYEAFYAGLYLGADRLPATVLLAFVTNVGLVWFTYRATGSALFSLVPGVVWMGVMIMATARTAEGDLLITGANWVGLVTLFTGVAGYVFGAYRMVIRRPQPPPVPGPPAAVRPWPFQPPRARAGGPARPEQHPDPPQWSTPR